MMLWFTGVEKRLHQEDVSPADVLTEPHEDVLIGELEDLHRAGLDIEVLAHVGGKGAVRVPGEDS